MAIRKVVECRVLEKLTKKLEPFKVGDVVSVQNQTGNYDDVLLTSYKEIRLKKINILKVFYSKDLSMFENGARWCLMMLFLLLYDGCQGKNFFKGRSINSHIISFKMKLEK